MGISTAGTKLYLELWQRGLLGNIKSVLEMGSQELHLTKNDFENLVRAAGITTYKEENFPNLANWPGAPRCPAKAFYEMLGAEEYACIDLNEVYGAIPIDLNLPLTDSSLYGKYDLVSDFGPTNMCSTLGKRIGQCIDCVSPAAYWLSYRPYTELTAITILIRRSSRD